MHHDEPTRHWDRQEEDDADDERAAEATQPYSLAELVESMTLEERLQLSIAMPELIEKFRREIQ